MISISLEPGSSLFIVFIIFLSSLLVLLFYYLFFFIRVGFTKAKKGSSPREGISVVICARNSYFFLKENLPLLLDQNHPEFEIVVVNYASDDDSSYLLNNLAEEFPRLKIVEIKENLNFFSGKKFPLSIGIKSAQYDLILLTEPDCKPLSPNWLTEMARGFEGKKEVVISYSSYEKGKGFFNKLVRYENTQKAITFLSFAIAGVPYKGLGRNMAFRRSLFFRNKGFISHYRLGPGEDDLFINKVARNANTNVIIVPEAFTITALKYDFRNWFLEKKRRLLTPFFYRFHHQLLLAIYNISLFLFYSSFIALAILKYNLLLIVAVFIFRWIAQMPVNYFSMNRLKEKDLPWLAPIFEPLMMVVNCSAFISKIFVKKKKWR